MELGDDLTTEKEEWLTATMAATPTGTASALKNAATPLLPQMATRSGRRAAGLALQSAPFIEGTLKQIGVWAIAAVAVIIIILKLAGLAGVG